MQELCDKLNKVIFEKKEGFVDELNELINDAVTANPRFHLYWQRDVWINCGFDDDKARKLVTGSDQVMFVPSDDPEEHPGVVVKYKE